MAALGVARRTQEDGCDLHRGEEVGRENQCGNGGVESSDVHREPLSPTSLLRYMDEQVPAQEN